MWHRQPYRNGAKPSGGATDTNGCLEAKLLLVHGPLAVCATRDLVAADLSVRVVTGAARIARDDRPDTPR